MHLREDVHLDHGVKIDYLVAERAKDNASKKIDGSDIDGFAKIPAYIRSIKAHNPNSHAVVRVVQDQFFLYSISVLSPIACTRWNSPQIKISGGVINSSGS
ncbi:hypothetical protein POJ06DRAFT_281332 [Lipomyces tetrasporus]|uniref:Uncharacterized protein n=1 Tax=Lipomyces tetrasporus TaxID=54092 RepID=A0AAD7VTI5_9ASCO|nr:uncharacterized protein POJ06DRAFT_281332 [Lipomyces tetrasporus]KAJ8100195.1 hypothetical protein POJ06DRAFT_281332 [Lipomyces tetrasporus]